jgi:hypothetical protein
MTPIWFFYHLPKTGGQTLRDHLAQEIGRNTGYLHLGKWDREMEFGREEVAAMDPAERDRLTAIGGHPLCNDYRDFFPDRAVREITFIREPAARIVSHYNFNCTMMARRGQPAPPFEAWLGDKPANLQSTRLAQVLGMSRKPLNFSKTLHALQRFFFVGTTENLDRMLPLLLGSMGLNAVIPQRSNVTGGSITKFLDPTPDLLTELRSRNSLDVMLHEVAKSLEDRVVERIVERHTS